MNWTRLWPTPKPRPVIRDNDGMIDFRVIGELRDNRRHLLMHGDDDHYYDYDLESGEITAVELDESWAVDVDRPVPVMISAPIDSIAS